MEPNPRPTKPRQRLLSTNSCKIQSTLLLPEDPFYIGESYHQQYYEKTGGEPLVSNCNRPLQIFLRRLLRFRLTAPVINAIFFIDLSSYGFSSTRSQTFL